jgi:hypothetical protein
MTTLPIYLSSGLIPTVTVHDRVAVGQVIARGIPETEYVINVADEFSVSADRARKYLVKNPGERIVAGDVLAVKKSRLGFKEEKLVSNVTGLITRFERDSGNLIVLVGSGSNQADVVSPVDGIVTMCDNEKIFLGTEKDVFTGRKAIGGSVTGEAYVIENAFSGIESSNEDSGISLYYSLDSRAVGKIIIGRNFSRDLLIKSIGIGAVGIIGIEIRDEDIEYLSGRKMQIPILEVDNNTTEQLIRWKGKRFHLNSQEKIVLFLHA